MLVAYLLAQQEALADDTLSEPCTNDHAFCDTWKVAGECHKNKSFMDATCPLACGACPPPIPRHLIELADDAAYIDLEQGRIVLGFFKNAAPLTTDNILNLFRKGCFRNNHIFRLDRGFVAQVQSVSKTNSRGEISDECDHLGRQRVPLEPSPIRHVPGVLSMGRSEDRNSGTSSFSMLLGKAPHLDNEYTIFGKVVSGVEILRYLEAVTEVKQQGIFVMPKKRITIVDAGVGSLATLSAPPREL